MSQAYKCDICHKLFVHDTKTFRELGISYYDRIGFASSSDLFSNTTINMDVCPDCMLRLMKDANLYKLTVKED